jgi:hypothetical protein
MRMAQRRKNPGLDKMSLGKTLGSKTVRTFSEWVHECNNNSSREVRPSGPVQLFAGRSINSCLPIASNLEPRPKGTTVVHR